MVGDALQVMDYQGSPHPPLGCTGCPFGGVGYEVHGLRVEEVHLVVSRLEAAGAVHVAVREGVEALMEYVASGLGHLNEDSLEVLVALLAAGVDDRPADMLA